MSNTINYLHLLEESSLAPASIEERLARLTASVLGVSPSDPGVRKLARVYKVYERLSHTIPESPCLPVLGREQTELLEAMAANDPRSGLTVLSNLRSAKVLANPVEMNSNLNYSPMMEDLGNLISIKSENYSPYSPYNPMMKYRGI